VRRTWRVDCRKRWRNDCAGGSQDRVAAADSYNVIRNCSKTSFYFCRDAVWWGRQVTDRAECRRPRGQACMHSLLRVRQPTWCMTHPSAQLPLSGRSRVIYNASIEHTQNDTQMRWLNPYFDEAGVQLRMHVYVRLCVCASVRLCAWMFACRSVTMRETFACLLEVRGEVCLQWSTVSVMVRCGGYRWLSSSWLRELAFVQPQPHLSLSAMSCLQSPRHATPRHATPGGYLSSSFYWSVLNVAWHCLKCYEVSESSCNDSALSRCYQCMIQVISVDYPGEISGLSRWCQ